MKTSVKYLILLAMAISRTGNAQPLAGADELGRALPLNAEAGDPEPDRQVGNRQNDKDPMDWYVNGDVAPDARFNYLYTTHE
jgi:hypothetical protein